MPATRTLYSLVLLLLTLHQLVVGMSANLRDKSEQKSSLTSVKPHSNAVNEEEEKTARDVGHYNFTHTARDVGNHNFTHTDKDVRHYNSTQTAGDVAHNFTHTADVHTGSRSPHVGSDDKIDINMAHRNGRSTRQRAEEHKHLISETANFKSAWENLTDIKHEREMLENVSHDDAYRTLQPTHIDPGARNTESGSPVDSRSESPPRNNQQDQQSHVTQSPPAGDAKTVGRVKSTIKDWFLQLTKRFNSPLWLIRQLDSFTSASENQTGPLPADSESTFNRNNTWFSDDNNTVANGDNNWPREWPPDDLLDSRLEGLSESPMENNEDNFTIDAYKQESKYAEENNSLDNRHNSNVGELLDTESLNQHLSESRMNESEQTHLPAIDNSSISDNVFDDEYFNSTANNGLPALDELRVSNDSSECPSCRGHALSEESVKEIRLKMFKNLLAQKLRRDANSLSQTSRGSLQENVPIIPESLVEQTLRDNAREYERDEFHARDQEIIIAGEDMGRDCIKLHVTGCYSFRLKGRFRADVAEAQLWLYKMEDPSDFTGQTFTLYELERLKSGRLSHSSMIASVDTLTTQGWVVLNVTRSLIKWLDKRKGTKVIAIRCVTCASRGHRALYGAKLGYKPLLIAKFVADNGQVRGKRSASCDPRYDCCKRELVVNFQEIGMSDILQPRQLSVGYCFGECNEIHSHRSNHTVIRQRVRWSEPLANQHSMKQQLKPCCVPVVLKDITILTSDGDGSIVVKLLPKVVVETCGCM